MPKMRVAAIVHGIDVVNIIVLSPNPDDAASYCENFDGVCIVRDSNGEYGTEFVTLTGCVAVEVTDMPGVGFGWTFVGGEFVPPPESELAEVE